MTQGTGDDAQQFEEAMKGVEPLKLKAQKADLTLPPKTTPGQDHRQQNATIAKDAPENPLNVSHLQMVQPQDSISYSKPGLAHGVMRKMKQGAFEIEARLDLHGKTVEQARIALLRFVQDCRRYHVRLAIVLHGKGEQGDPPALLKSYTNRWLREIPEVLAFHTAPKHHGGVGAVYVLIKKQDQKHTEGR